MRCRRVGMIPARVDLDAQAASLQQKIEPRLADARAGQRTVPFVDAAHFVLLRVIERLDLSIHNNRNETDQRDVAKKRQISAGPAARTGDDAATLSPVPRRPVANRASRSGHTSKIGWPAEQDPVARGVDSPTRYGLNRLPPAINEHLAIPLYQDTD